MVRQKKQEYSATRSYAGGGALLALLTSPAEMILRSLRQVLARDISSLLWLSSQCEAEKVNQHDLKLNVKDRVYEIGNVVV
jgi:hypothetical protein